MNTLPLDIISFFTSAGWTPHRRQYLSQDILNKIPDNHPAINLLTEFLGLKVGACGPGEQCATSDIEFRFIADDWDDISTWNDLLHTKLIGIAEVHHRHEQLYIDQTGKCYVLSGVSDDFSYCGADFTTAMQNLLLGRRLRPMLLPGQESVMLYGITYTADNPEIYEY